MLPGSASCFYSYYFIVTLCSPNMYPLTTCKSCIKSKHEVYVSVYVSASLSSNYCIHLDHSNSWIESVPTVLLHHVCWNYNDPTFYSPNSLKILRLSHQFYPKNSWEMTVHPPQIGSKGNVNPGFIYPLKAWYFIGYDWGVHPNSVRFCFTCGKTNH